MRKHCVPGLSSGGGAWDEANIAAATKIGSIFFAAMEASENSSNFCQLTWNHWFSQTAAQSHKPDANSNIWRLQMFLPQ